MTLVRSKKGFTLIELMLALAFLAFVLIFVVTTIIQVMRTYNKGLAIKEINQTARAAMEDMTRSIRPASLNTIYYPLNASLQSVGRACFGSISYVWNVANSSTNKYSSAGNPRVTFVRIDDLGATMCTPNASGVYPNVDPAKATQLLSDNAWVQIINVAKDTTSNLVTITMQLSTKDDLVPPSLELRNPSNPAEGVTCKGGSEGQFCAVADFSTTVATKGDN